MYLLLGCGDVGYSLASKLRDRKAEFTIIDQDENKIWWLKALGYNAVAGDFRRMEVLRLAGIENAEIVLVLAQDFPTVEQTLATIDQLKRSLMIDPVVVVRITDEAEVPEVKRLGASAAMASTEILADFALKKFDEFAAMAKERRLRAMLRDFKGRMAIVLQTNPDPDSISSGMALKRYLGTLGIEADIVYDGEIGHQQNRALVNLLNIELRHVALDGVKFEEYDAFALVDVATPANCALPKDIVPMIVIDHHSVPSGEVRARYQDITAVGATATLLTNYLRYAGIEMDPSMATALAFGILTDTMNFTRGATPLDFDAFEYLRKFMNTDQLIKLQSPAISPDTLDVLARAIKASKLKGGYLISNVGFIKDKDAIAQAADFLLQREGAMTVLVYGIGEQAVYVSARTSDIRLHLGRTLKEIFGDIGSAGGHPTMAGATIPLKAFGKISDKKALKGAVERAVGLKFLEHMGVVKPKPKR
ncbi:MAG: DHH family phosphoesterase [Candidatus Hadarchaeales archaeon]